MINYAATHNAWAQFSFVSDYAFGDNSTQVSGGRRARVLWWVGYAGTKAASCPDSGLPTPPPIRSRTGNSMSAGSFADPVAGSPSIPSLERIEVLDVVRGTALIGIFIMNVEFFNRPLAELGQGMRSSLSGGDWLVGWLIYNFVQGKFWTMFSLLFGMGFAIMLRRAELAERAFLPSYLRRICALMLFGVLHHVFIWGGDILFSYALGAVGLLLLLYARIRSFGLALMLLLALGYFPGLQWAWEITEPLAMLAVAAILLRQDLRFNFPGRSRLARTRNVGVALYLAPYLMMTVFGAIDYRWPQPLSSAATSVNVESWQKQVRESIEETRILTRGKYGDAIRLRAANLVESAPDEAGFTGILVGMFLIGTWFVRAGVMDNTKAHLPLFRKLAWFGLPIGVGMGLLGNLIATSSSAALADDPYFIASGLALMGNLPACLGYVSVIVLLLHSGRFGASIGALAPLG
ncbi:MAG: DUF418 domain-containing protein, partial [Arenimonas sp.]